MFRSRGRTRRGSATLVNPLRAILPIFSGGSVFTADRFTIDAVSGKVASIVDWLDGTHTLAQATSANQVAAPGPDANLLGARSFSFGGSARYLSSRSASAWKYLHDGTGFFSVAIFVPDTDGSSVATNCIFGTVRQQDTATQVGITVSYTTTTTTGGCLARIARANATLTISQTPTTQFSQNVPGSLRFDYLEGAGTEFHLLKLGVSLASGASAAAPSSADPQTTLCVGANASSFDRGLTGRLAFLGLAPRIPSAAEIAQLSAYTTAKYGVAV